MSSTWFRQTSAPLVSHSVHVKNTFIQGYCDNAPSSEDDDETRLSDGSFVPQLVRSTSEPDMMTIKLMEQSTSPSPLTSQTMGDLPLYQPDDEFDENASDDTIIKKDADDGMFDDIGLSRMTIGDNEDMWCLSGQASGDSEYSRQVSSTIGDKGIDLCAKLMDDDINGLPCLEFVPQTTDSPEPEGERKTKSEKITNGVKSPSSDPDNGGLYNANANGDAEKLMQQQQAYWVMPANQALMAPCAWMANGLQVHGPSYCGPNMPLQNPALADASMHSWQNITTVMMRNLPNKFTQDLLLVEIDAAGFSNTYDFVYLPMDPDTNANRGYAFINFTTPGYAFMFKTHFDGWNFRNFNSHKVVSVVPATVQGYDANYALYSKSRVRQLDPAETRPLFLREAGCGKSRQGRRQKPMSMIDIAAAKNLHHQLVQHPKQQEVNAKASEAAEADTDKKGSDTEATPSYSMPRVPRFCPYCGAHSRSNFKFCGYCGAGLDH